MMQAHDELPEADAQEQERSVEPDETVDHLPAAGGPEELVTESDWLDQQREVPMSDADAPEPRPDD